jgi:hypothetical protein
MGWVVNVMPYPRFSLEERTPVPIGQESGWAPEPVWTQARGKPFCFCQGLNPDHVHSKTLYLLSYPSCHIAGRPAVKINFCTQMGALNCTTESKVSEELYLQMYTTLVTRNDWNWMGHISYWPMLMTLIQYFGRKRRYHTKNTEALLDASKEVGQGVNPGKTKYML